MPPVAPSGSSQTPTYLLELRSMLEKEVAEESHLIT